LSWPRSAKTLGLLAAAAFAVALGMTAYLSGVWPRLENDTVDVRFGLRPATQPSDVVVVGIDDATFSDLGVRWPFPRSLHARAIDRLHADGAKAIVYDVQFTEPTTSRQDLALFDAVRRAGNVVLATTETDGAGHANVLGGDRNVARAHAVAATSNLPSDAGGVIRRYPYAALGRTSVAVAAAAEAGRPISPDRFPRAGAWIDFRGPPGTIKTVSFSDLIRGKLDPRVFAGKVVVVGATAPTLQDVHPTSTASHNPMTGAEIQANAIWTALHGNPLRSAPGWEVVIAILIAGLVAPLASVVARVFSATLIAGAVGVGFAALAQFAFYSGTIVAVSYPLATSVLAGIGMLVANYAAARVERNEFAQQVSEAQLEIVHRLAQATESRDDDTGQHIVRIGLLCRRLALELGMSEEEAEMLRHASAMHDVGKIAIPDRILLKPRRLDAEEWQTMKTHTTAGARVLAGSSSPLVQMAETIARTHHERWDGSGYPAGLRGEEIPLVGRVCAVCDVFDGLLAKRPYKDPWSVGDALIEIQLGSDTQFDPRVVDAFMRLAPELARIHAAAAPATAINATVPRDADDPEPERGRLGARAPSRQA
jgi:CHASE2 domain-containing sensor protein